MQKFGLHRNHLVRVDAIEQEVIREQASALGRAGDKLRISLLNHETLLHQKPNTEQVQESTRQISKCVWALMLQREFLGFTENNLNWVRANYTIPDEAIDTLGVSG